MLKAAFPVKAKTQLRNYTQRQENYNIKSPSERYRTVEARIVAKGFTCLKTLLEFELWFGYCTFIVVATAVIDFAAA